MYHNSAFLPEFILTRILIKLHNVFMRVNVSKPFVRPCPGIFRYLLLPKLQDPEIQKVTGKTNPVDVMAALREMKNSM